MGGVRLIVLAAMALVGCERSSSRPAAPTTVSDAARAVVDVRGLEDVDIVLAVPDGEPRAASLLRKRLADASFDAVVEPGAAGRLAIHARAIRADRRALLRRVLTGRGRLEAIPVVAGDPAMRRLESAMGPGEVRAKDDALCAEYGPSADPIPPCRRRVFDVYLEAARRAPLEAYLAANDVAPTPGRAVLLQQTPGAWRTHVVARDRALAPTVTAARVVADPVGGGPQVLLELDEGSKLAFATFTEARVGEKVALVVDGVVSSVPVIASKIDGGKLMLTTDGEDDAAVLASVFATPLAVAPSITDERATPTSNR